MYTEEYDKRKFPFRDFLLKIILIIIFVFLLVWLLPKFITPTLDVSEEISPLTAQIFGDNLEKMKDAAINYYTSERLPQTVGESKQMTLREMIANNLVIPFVDKNGKACDVDASYVKITKEDSEYLLKVNLKCSDQEDYILVHLGCYNYCTGYICEKESTAIVIPSGSTSNNGSSQNNSGSNQSNNNNNNTNNDPIPVEPTPEPTPPVPEENVTLLYEYSKTTGAKYSEWTAWSNWALNTEGHKVLTCDENDPSCIKMIQLFQRTEKVGSYQKPYKVARNEIKQVASYTEIACNQYEYVRIDEITYQTTTNYSTWNQITNTTNATTGSWVFAGYVTQALPDTATTKYKLVGADFSNCSTTCTSLPTFKYAKYTLSGDLQNVTASGSPSTDTLISSSETKRVNTSISASCTATTTKTIPVYRTITTYDIAYHEEPLYGTVEYYSMRTRKVLSEGKTTIKWSEYNDTSLLNDGYHYTGNTKEK